MSFIQLGFSALAVTGLLALAMILAVLGIIEGLSSGFNSSVAVNQFLFSASLGMLGALCLPSVWMAAKRLLSQPQSITQAAPSSTNRWDAYRIVSILMLTAFPLSLVLGNLAVQSEQIAWLVLPPLNLLATGLPVLWLALLGTRKLSGGSKQRRWGLLTCGLAYSTPLILTAEILLLIAGGLLILAWLSTQPQALNEILDLIRQLRHLPTPDQETILRLVEPYLNRPSVVIGLMFTAALFVPLIEELLKPLGVWLLAWKKLTPAEGWVAGVISGAAFALFENLGNTSGASQEWALVTVSRITAALLHMLTSGLMGWSIATAWTKRRYLRLFTVYAAAVTIHGLWNGLAILGSVSVPFDLSIESSTELPVKSLVAMIGLILLGIFNLALFLKMNRSLRPKLEGQLVE